MMLSCGLCEKSIDTDQDEFLISKRLRNIKMNDNQSVNFHYDCALEHDELMTYDDFNDRGSEREDYRNDLD